MNDRNTNWNDIKSTQEIIKAWQYLKAKGYATDSEIIKKYENAKF